MYRIIILSVLLIVFNLSGFCQNIHKDSIAVDFIEFGSGGGFTGASKNYLLTKTGELYVFKNILADPNSLVYLKTVKKCSAKNIFTYTKKKKIIEITYNEPGNLFHYITLSINHTNKKLVWGSTNSITPKPLITLSTKLYNIL